MAHTSYILGAGSLGLLYAARLALTGKSVCLLVKHKQVNHLTLGITLHQGVASLAKRVFVRVKSQPEPRLQIQQLILATKAGQAAAALQTWLPNLNPEAEILLLQNGLGSQAEVAKLVQPQHTLLAASVTEAAFLAEPAKVVHSGQGNTQLGRWCGPDQQAAARWASRLTLAGLNTQAVEPIRPALWHKLALNAVINPLTALHKIENGALASREYQPQVQRLCQETLQLFQRLGLEEPEGGLAYRLEQVILATAANKSSMLQDLQAGRPTELDYITGALLKAAQAVKLKLPAHQQIYQQIKAAAQHPG